MPIYSNMPEDFYPRPSDVNAPLRSTIGIGPRGPKGHSITAKIIDTDPYGYFRVQFKDVETGEVLVTTPNLDVGSRFFVYGRHLENVVEGDTETVNNYDFTSLQASSDHSAIRVGDIVFFTMSTTDETFLTLDTIGVGVVNSVNGTQVSFVATNIMTAQLRDSSITTDMLADLCVTTTKLANEAVTTAKLDDESVTTAKLDDEAVTTAKLDNEAVTTAKLDDGAVSTNKIADGVVTDNKLDQSGLISRALQWNGAINAPLAQILKPGTYTVAKSNTQTIGLPSDMNANFGILIATTNEAMEFYLLEAAIPIRTWKWTSGTGWLRTTDQNLSSPGASADAKVVGDILTSVFRWFGGVNRPIAQITTPGTYTVSRANSQTIGLPDGMIANYGTLIAINDVGSEFFLFESTTPIRMWRYNANTWFRLTDATLTGEGAAADAKATGDRIAAAASTYKGTATDLEAAGTGYWTFAKASVPTAQLPPNFTQNYGYLFKFNTANTNDGYFVIQANYNFPTVWLKTINDWIQLTNRAEDAVTGKKIAFIGDSITEYNSTASYNYVKLFETYGGAVVQNLGVSGTGYCRHHENSQNFINRVASINADTDIIVVAGSFNDLGTSEPLGDPTDTGSTTVCGYINAFYDALIAAFPTKPVFVYTMNYWSGFQSNPDRFLNYVDAVRTICRHRAVSFVDVGEQCGIRPWDTSNATTLCPDGTHPNNAGHKLMYPIIKNQIINNITQAY